MTTEELMAELAKYPGAKVKVHKNLTYVDPEVRKVPASEYGIRGGGDCVIIIPEYGA